MPEQHYNPEQLKAIDEQARLLLEDATLGLLIRQACSAAPASRRERTRALYAVTRIALGEPVLADIITQAVRRAWREKMTALVGDYDVDLDVIRDAVADLLRKARER